MVNWEKIRLRRNYNQNKFVFKYFFSVGTCHYLRPMNILFIMRVKNEFYLTTNEGTSQMKILFVRCRNYL